MRQRTGLTRLSKGCSKVPVGIGDTGEIPDRLCIPDQTSASDLSCGKAVVVAVESYLRMMENIFKRSRLEKLLLCEGGPEKNKKIKRLVAREHDKI